MTRGGNGKPDGEELYTTADGRQLKLLTSTKSKNGYFCVAEIRPGQFYPKKKMDGEKGSKKMKTFGKAQPNAQAAAIKLAEFLDAPYELTVAPPRQPMDTEIVDKRRLWALQGEMATLIGMTREDLFGLPMEKVWVAPRSVQDQVASGAPEVPCRVVGEGEEPEPEPEPAAAQPPVALFDPAVLAQVARIQAAAPTVPVQGCE